MTNAVEPEWRSAIARRQPTTLEIDPTLSLRLICGVDAEGQPIFFSISTIKPGLPGLSEDVTVSRHQREIDGEWVLLLTLNGAKYTDIFVQFCAHIVGRISQTGSEPQALAMLLSSVDDWLTFMRPAQSVRLSHEALRGLIGELWVGFSVLAENHDIKSILDAWNGPFGADQDFQFPGGPSLEVKTVQRTSRRVQIASEHQLVIADRKSYLAALTLTKCVDTTAGSITLPVMLTRVVDLLRRDGIALAHLDRRMSEFQCNFDDEYYSDQHFLAEEVRFYEVREGFPHIAAASLPSGVSRVGYSVELAAIEPFECSLSDMQVPIRESMLS